MAAEFDTGGQEGKEECFPDSAIAHAQKRIRCLDKWPDAADAANELIGARTVLGLYHTQINHWVEAREKGNSRRLGQIRAVMGCYHGFVDEDFPKAFEALDAALRIADEQKDVITLILTSMWLGILQAFDCGFEKGRRSIQRAIDISASVKNQWGIASQQAQQAYFCYYWAGRIESLADVSSEALKVAMAVGDHISKGMFHTTYGVACYAKGHMKDALTHCLEGRALCERIAFYGWAALGCLSLAKTYFDMSEYHKSTEC